MTRKIMYLTSTMMVLTTILCPLASEGQDYVVVRSWPEGPGFRLPMDIAVDSFGNMYVADTDNYRIMKLSPSGDALLWWGGRGTDDGQTSYPSGIAVDIWDNVYVAEALNGRIQKFTSEGVFLEKWGERGDQDGQFDMWEITCGIAIDNSGHVYVADAGNGRIQKFTSEGVFIGWWGKDDAGYTGWHNPGSGRVGRSGTDDGQFDWPTGVAVDSSGYVYVAEHNSHRIQKFTSEGVFIGWWGKDDAGYTGWHNPGSGRVGRMGSDDGQFAYPYGVAMDASGNVYVADSSNHRIQKFTPWGNCLAAFGTTEYPFSPFGIALSASDNIYVTDFSNYCIQKFDSDGVFLARLGISGAGDGQFHSLWDVAVDGSGNVYVADYGNRCIQKFDSGGNFLTKWGAWGADDGQFRKPSGVAVDVSGNVYVADYDMHRIQKFTSQGIFIGWWGKDDAGYTGWHNPGSGRMGRSGSDDGQFYNPSGLEVDNSGSVYVADSWNGRIQKFDLDGNFQANWDTAGRPRDIAVDNLGNIYVATSYNIQKFTSGGELLAEWKDSEGQYYHVPSGIAVDGSGNVYVADTENHRIQKFTSDGDFLTQWGIPGCGEENLWLPRGIDVSKLGEVYVADTGNQCIKVYLPTQTYAITPSADEEHGSILPSDEVTVECGSDQTFIITPNAGCNILDVIVDDETSVLDDLVDLGGSYEYTFENVVSDHTIHAIFLYVEILAPIESENLDGFNEGDPFCTLYEFEYDTNVEEQEGRIMFLFSGDDGDIWNPFGFATDDGLGWPIRKITRNGDRTGLYVEDVSVVRNYDDSYNSSRKYLIKAIITTNSGCVIESELIRDVTFGFHYNWRIMESTNFVLHYVVKGDEGGPGIDYLRTLPANPSTGLYDLDTWTQAFESAWNRVCNSPEPPENKELGYGTPHEPFGPSKYPVYIGLQGSAAGETRFCSNTDSSHRFYWSYICVPYNLWARDAYILPDGESAVAAHELLHAIQPKYYVNPYANYWWAEASARWIENAAADLCDIPCVNVGVSLCLYKSAQLAAVNDWLGKPEKSLNNINNNCHGSSIFLKYLTEVESDTPDIIRGIYGRIQGSDDHNVMDAIEAELGGKAEFERVFRDFVVENYVQDRYDDAICYDAVSISETYYPDDLPVQDVPVLLKHLASSYIQFCPNFDLQDWRRVYIKVKVPLDGSIPVGGAAVIDQGVPRYIEIDSKGYGEEYVDIYGLNCTLGISGILVLVNWSKTGGKKDFSYWASVGYRPSLVLGDESPVDIAVTCPDGTVFTRDMELPVGICYVEADIDNDGEIEDRIGIMDPTPGQYAVGVIPEANASLSDIYTLTASYCGSVTVLAKDVAIRDIPPVPYIYSIQEPLRLSLSTGWNLISLPMQPVDSTAISVLSSVQEACLAVWTYTPNLGWEWYSPIFPQVGGLRELNSGIGYWIFMQEAAELTLTGTLPAPEIPLAKGWNLVGYCLQTPKDIQECMSSIMGSFNSVWEYDPDEGWHCYLPDAPGASNLWSMAPRYGYWIDATEDRVWNASNEP